MVGRRAGLIAILVLVSSVPLTRGQETADDALRKLKAVFEEAATLNKLELLKPHLHEPFSFVTYTDREFTDFDEFKRQWDRTRERLLAGGSYSVTLKPERSDIYGDLAIARGNSDNVIKTGAGEEYRFGSHWTAVCRKVDGEWKIVRAHSSLNPFDNPLLRAEIRKASVRYGAAAIASGIALGVIATLLLTRSRRRAVREPSV